MKKAHKLLVLVIATLLVLFTSQETAKPDNSIRYAVFEVAGSVTFQTSLRAALRDTPEVVVWLVPLDAIYVAGYENDPPRYQIQQRKKKFEPSLLVVPVGSTVDFLNRDLYFHSVFSVARGKRFDLGLYRGGQKKAVRFDRTGPAYVFCKLHSDMLAVVLAVDSNLFGVSDGSGHISIPNVLPGRYLLHVWYDGATKQELKVLERPTTLTRDNHQLPSISIAMATWNSGTNRN
jgi:plastocyanin